jgi:hypothetical protein
MYIIATDDEFLLKEARKRIGSKLQRISGKMGHLEEDTDGEILKR